MKPITLSKIDRSIAFEFVNQYHRHHSAPTGDKWRIGAFHNEKLVGVAIVGRPSSRILDSRGWLEVTRTCTVVWGVNRKLYEYVAAWATIHNVIVCTYTLETETGESLLRAGWVPTARRGSYPSDWFSPARYRDVPLRPARIRWQPK